MQLTPEQIQQLFEFTEKKMVRYYDLQIELVDHLASRIEEKMDDDPALSFETALQDVYKEFGLFGFSKIEQEKLTQLTKLYERRFWDEVKKLFRWPEIMTVTFFLFLIIVVTRSTNEITLLFIAVGIYILYMLTQIFINNKFKPKKKLLATSYFSSPIITLYFLAPFFVIEQSKYLLAAFIFIALVSSLATLRISFVIKKEAKNNFPGAYA